MESPGSGVSCNQFARGNPKDEHPSRVESPSNYFQESDTSKTDEKGDENQTGTELREVSISSFSHFPGFPRLILPRHDFHANQTYARSFFPSGHGYPLCQPNTVARVSQDFKQNRGICIGDVGILTRRTEFVFMFNIFLPADHRYNKDRTPDSFYPLDPLKDSEICTSVDYFPRGSVVTSKGIKVTRHSEDPLHLTFESSEPQGSFLILPEGATRQNISTNTTRVRDYVAHNAVKWASFFANNPDYAVANGATYVVTGVDKTSICSMLTFPHHPSLTKMSAEYRAGRLTALEDMSVAYNEDKGESATHVPNNLCVFLRGIRVGLGRAEWLENVDERKERFEPYTEVFIGKPRQCFLKRKFKFGLRTKCVQYRTFSTHPFHLSDTVSQIMLNMSPDASLVLLDDSIWYIFSQEISESQTEGSLTFSALRGASFDDFGVMLDMIFGLFNVVETQGM
ncbi:hypothetical protein M413DRAFT_355425 [Hebeloma cylindrosporum]|uniref:Uncharacterized protein n=1 Tax=Hebeloma cylindrosporum TaxID=76867 RepID=A0A0C2Y3X2_HEBCY|nr:hypothetical protein M413DRAFT_355425 [Hebeloma cylindrosporum h7]